MTQQKLYTEEQVKQVLQICQDSDLYDDILTFDDILKTQIPIELPSDEEIMEESYKQGGKIFSFTNGAKWMRDKILNK